MFVLTLLLIREIFINILENKIKSQFISINGIVIVFVEIGVDIVVVAHIAYCFVDIVVDTGVVYCCCHCFVDIVVDFGSVYCR